MILPLFLVLAFQLTGEMLARLSPLPIPGPVIGMLLLVAGLVLEPRLLVTLRALSQTILGNLSLLFVPAGVGIVGHAELLQAHAAGVFVAIVVSTILAMAVAALTFQGMVRWLERRSHDA